MLVPMLSPTMSANQLTSNLSNATNLESSLQKTVM